MKKSRLGEMYHRFHSMNNKYGFVHHLTTKGGFFRKEIGTGKRVLDLGSRDGTLASLLVDSNKVTCLDIDFEGLNLCREKTKAEVVWHDLNDPLPFRDAEFDVVLLSDVLEHVIMNDQLVQECYRVLRDGGIFLGSTPNAYFWSNRIKMLLGIDLIRYIDPTHVRHFSLDSLRDLIGGVFSLIEILPYGRHRLARVLPRIFASDFMWKALKKGGPR